MVKAISVILFFFLLQSNTSAQVSSVLNNAIKLGTELKFEEAIDLLKTEVKNNPTNADAYYWLGRYAHFLVYDSRPFTKKSDSWSRDQVIANLKKSISLKTDLGDAYYFLATEYGARSREALRKKDYTAAKNEYLEAYKSGAFPKYILEYAKCILNSCDKDAILFSNWDAPVNAIAYLQLVEGIRKDVSLVILNLLERPYYLKIIRDGIKNEIPKTPITWNDDLIMGINSWFPWKKQVIKIQIDSTKKKEYNFPSKEDNINLEVSGKYGGESLWIGTAAVINILENNKFKRPIFCAFPFEDDMFDFKDYLKCEGFVSRLMPYKVNSTSMAFDINKIQASLLNPKNYLNFNDIKLHSQPRANFFFADNRRHLILDYIEYLISINKLPEAKSIYLKMDSLMPTATFPLSDDLKKRLLKIEKLLH